MFVGILDEKHWTENFLMMVCLMFRQICEVWCQVLVTIDSES